MLILSTVALQVGHLLALDLLLFVWRSLPLVGRFAAPVSHYMSMARVMGPRRAAAMSLLGLWPPAELWVFQFMRLWRTSRVSQSSMQSHGKHHQACAGQAHDHVLAKWQ